MFRNLLAVIGVLAVLAAAFVFAIIWTGTYNVAADSGQGLIDRIAEFTRENSVASHDASVVVPPLSNPEMVADGAARYDKRCTICHLAPGMQNNKMRPGMNPEPPELARRKHPVSREDFWIIKHGIKMTAMPAWGATLPDSKLWGLVAFLQKLPGMSAQRYHALVAQGRPQAAPAAPATGAMPPPANALPPPVKAPPGTAAAASTPTRAPPQ